MNILRNNNAFLFTGITLFCALAAGETPGVLLLSVDTLRADFLGCYGGEWDISPNIDRLAEKSLVFENACCETPLTAPSFTAMLTSRYPRMSGVTRNGMHVADEAPLITELFREAGYYTFAVQSNWTLRARLSGLNRGFDFYEDDLDKRRWGLFNGERRAEEVTRVALEALRNRPADKPFFAWIHYSDPHGPYQYHADFSPVRRGLRTMDPRERVRVKYASEVAYADHHIGVLLKALPEGTRILFVADHGENLYEHGYLGHGRYLYQEGLHVPFMVCGPDIAPGRTPLPAQTMDVGPTLLGLAGLPPAPFALGKNLAAGMPPEDRPRFMETYGGAVPKLPGAKMLLTRTSPAFQAVIRGGWKLIRPQDRPATLYYLPEDPGEQRARRGTDSGVYGELNKLLDQWNATHPHGVETAAELREEDLEAFQALGYVE